MAWQVTVGAFVHYIDASSKHHHAKVTAVTSQTVVDLQYGTLLAGTPGRVTAAAVSKKVKTTAGAGWYH